MSPRRLSVGGLIAGAMVAGLVAGGSRIYKNRSLDRTPSLQGIESPEASAAFARVASLPQMRLLHAMAIRRALALSGGSYAIGQAVDLGCGAGQLAVALANAAPALRITGVDLSADLLATARERAHNAGLAHRIDFRPGDASAVPFADASVDLVVSTLSLHHWDDPGAALNEIARVLRPGGAFLIFDLRRDMIGLIYILIWLATRYVVPEGLRHIGEPLGSRNASYTPAEAAALAQASALAGWRVASGPFWLSIEGNTLR